MKKFPSVMVLIALLATAGTGKETAVPSVRYPGNAPAVEHAPHSAVLTSLLRDNRSFSRASSYLARRTSMVKGQHPKTIVLSCADSRVSPELIFRASLGEIFTVRNAGNVVDDLEIGSIEYAAEHLGSELLLVIGHEKCGAVKATVEAASAAPSEGHDASHIHFIVEKIMPAVRTVSPAGKSEAAYLNDCVEANVRHVVADLVTKSPVLRHLIATGKLTVAGGRYNISTGRVEIWENTILAGGAGGH